MANPRYVGDKWTGNISLRIQNAEVPAKQDPFPIPTGGSSKVEMIFPGSPSVVIDSLTSGEVTITDAAAGDLSFIVPSAKSALVTPSSPATKPIAVDVVVYDTTGTQQQTFQFYPFPVNDRANA